MLTMPTGVTATTSLLTDARFDRPTNLARLQGWRGAELDAAVAICPHPHRIAPAACSVLALASAATGSIPLILATLATALAGVFARNHPFELAYNLWAGPRGRALPANRAAKRFGCAVGSLHLAGGAVALALGRAVVADVALVSLGGLALFVAASGICVPSLLFTLRFGADRGTRAGLLG